MSSAENSKYARTGVDVHKEGIEVFEATVKNLYPGAFCVVVQDPLNSDRGIVKHSDSVGSKVIQQYLHWKETDDLSYFQQSAQDVIAMNLDDVLCVGANEQLVFTDYIAINGFKLPKEEVLEQLNIGFDNCFKLLAEHGIKIEFAGGETADLPHQVRTIDVVGDLSASVEKENVITGYNIEPDNVIIGFRSGGQADYEDEENSGIMCNGLTLGRQCIMNRDYVKKYPEIVEPAAQEAGGGFTGIFSVDDYIEKLDMTVSEALMSPTRLYAPVIVRMLDDYQEHIPAIIHNTGGGQTKCLRLGKNVHYVKTDLIEHDPIFILIKKMGEVSWKEMYQDFNMGTGLEFIVKEKDVAEDMIETAYNEFSLEGKIIGHVEKSDGKNKLTIHTDLSPTGKFHYETKN